MRSLWCLVLLLVVVSGCGASHVSTSVMDGGPRDVGPAMDTNDGCSMTPGADAGTVGADTGPGNAPRPMAPLSTATVTSQTPTFHWALAAGGDGAHLQICHDRGCTLVEQTVDAMGTHGAPSTVLGAGVHFWRVASRTGATVGTDWSPTWEFFVGHASAPVDTSWGNVPDFNGDGYADVAVNSGGGGRVYVLAGGATGLATTGTVLSGPCGSADFGTSVVSIGDVNGDGYADLLVAAWPSGAAYVYLGGSSGLSSSAFTLTGPSVGTHAPPDGGMSYYGAGASGAGDVNGDGYADVIVGDGGEAHLYFGGPGGLATAPVVVTGPTTSYDFGFPVAGVGDLNGDGFADVAVGAYDDNNVYVYMGSAAGLMATPTTVMGPAGSLFFGAAVSAANDVNGDGYADLLVGSDESDGAYVYLGSATGPAMAPLNLTGPAGSLFGFSVAGAGDVNGDGFADVIIGGQSNMAWVFLGSAMGSFGTPITLTGPAGSEYGRVVSGVGDVNGDGYEDIVVGDPGSGSTVPGQASLYLGAATQPVTAPIPLNNPALDSGYGSSVAHAVPSAGAAMTPPRRAMGYNITSPSRAARTTASVRLATPSFIKIAFT